MQFRYFYGNQSEQFSFIRIPRLMLTDPLFAPLSIQAKLLYGVLLDRMGVSMRNGWYDEKNQVYIIYQISEIQEDLGFSKKKSMDYLGELEAFGLVEKKRRGRGLPSILYVKSFLISETEQRPMDDNNSDEDYEDDSDAEIETSEDSRSSQIDTSNTVRSTDFCTPEVPISTPLEVPKSTLLEVPKSTPLMNYNNKNYNNKNQNQSNLILSRGKDEDKMVAVIDYRNLILQNISLEGLKLRYPSETVLLDGIFDLILETVLNKGATMTISRNVFPTEVVRAKFLKLTDEHIEYALDCFRNNTSRVRNIRKYWLAILFNAPSTIDGYYTAAVNHDLAHGT